MSINFNNTNSIWASVLVETLSHLGLTTAVISPGARSTPLTLAFAEHPGIEAIPILDERSAAFFALGRARQTKQPIALVCTSGTAGANYYPAVIEAHESCVPLLILTADRPPELRQCNAGQTIDQQRLYGAYTRWYSELTTPCLDLKRLAYLRQTVVQGWERSLYPTRGPVHVNLPFRDPTPAPEAPAQQFAAQFPGDFFSSIGPLPLSIAPVMEVKEFYAEMLQYSRGILIAGIDQPQSPEPYCRAIANLSKHLGWPVLAEGLSPVRNYADLNPYLISTYDLMLRNSDLARELTSDYVIRIGETPTSKELRTWLERTQPRQWIVDNSDRNLDPLHGKTTHLRLSIEHLPPPPSPLPSPSPHLPHWLTAETQLRQALDQTFAPIEFLCESKIVWLLSQQLPTQTPLFVANSLPIRDMEWFWRPGNLQVQIYCNRGANGIDGTLSTALGIAHHNRSSVLLTGDLAFLHDTNGLLMAHQLQGHLTIVLINNKGGGIFEMLPVSQIGSAFETFFATPQMVHLPRLCAAYEIEYEFITGWQQLQERLNPLPQQGVRVLEICSDRKLNAQWRQQTFQALASLRALQPEFD